ncbi:MAG: hypothetical protein CMJ83_02125 [Planctomycetes bacterium]|nr:hypothetical protein [Planctomycetota bacterium]
MSVAVASASQKLAKEVCDLPLEEVACYLCQSSERKLLVDDPPFQVHLCSGCGLGYTSPRLDGARIHEIYGDSYFNSASAEAYGYSSYETDLEGYLRTFRRKAKVISRHVAQGPVLEIGCAAGAFLEVMRERDHEVWGVEISRGILEAARNRCGFEKLFCGRLDEVVSELPKGRFDILAMFDVIEHLSDPLKELALCHELVSDGGVLVLQTQDVSSRTRRMLGSKWHHFKQLEHIYHFSPVTIRDLLGRAGFEVVELTRRNAGKYVSFDFIGERLHRVAKIPRFLCQPLHWMGRRYLYVNPQDEMLVIAKKVKKPAG